MTPAWRISDAVWSLLAGFIAAAVALGVLGTTSPTPFETFAIVLPAQELATLATFYALARRVTPAPLRELGLPVRVADWWLVLVGLTLAVIAASVLDRLTDVEEAPQEIARIVDEASGLTILWAFLGTVVLAPLVEEVVFRGGLLAALGRRMPTVAAVLVTSGAFALFHYGGPDTLVVLPPLFVLGVVLAVVAVRKGVGAAVLLHSGFNLLAALALLLT